MERKGGEYNKNLKSAIRRRSLSTLKELLLNPPNPDSRTVWHLQHLSSHPDISMYTMQVKLARKLLPKLEMEKETIADLLAAIKYGRHSVVIIPFYDSCFSALNKQAMREALHRANMQLVPSDNPIIVKVTALS